MEISIRNIKVKVLSFDININKMPVKTNLGLEIKYFLLGNGLSLKGKIIFPLETTDMLNDIPYPSKFEPLVKEKLKAMFTAVE